MGQVAKLQAVHAVEAEALLSALSAEASRQRARLGKARDARRGARERLQRSLAGLRKPLLLLILPCPSVSLLPPLAQLLW
jgi:hypothetical protein